MTKKKRNANKPDDEPVLMDVKEAAAFLRLTRSTLDHYRCEGRGPIYRKHGTRVFYTRESLLAWSAGNAFKSTAQRHRPAK